MNDRGFTLMEVIIVAAIIGILAALAIPNYALFKSNAYIAMTGSDARNLAPAADYASSRTSAPTTIPLLASTAGPVNPAVLPGGTKSPGVYGTVDLFPNQYTIKTYHPAGDVCYTMDSVAGMSVSAGICP